MDGSNVKKYEAMEHLTECRLKRKNPSIETFYDDRNQKLIAIVN